VIREVATGKIYVLISGRWFEAQNFEGKWSVVRPDSLPAAFKDIAPASALGPARVSVAGTPEAEDAFSMRRYRRRRRSSVTRPSSK
jgi:hypothetical protein